MAVIDPGALRELRRRFGGRILVPDDPGYRGARRFDPENLFHLNANIPPSAGARG
jgi:hypothetical protein